MATDMFLKLGDIKGESKEVMVVSYSTSGNQDSDALHEDVGLNFARVEVSYQPQKADGGKDGGSIKYGWNIRENVKI